MTVCRRVIYEGALGGRSHTIVQLLNTRIHSIYLLEARYGLQMCYNASAFQLLILQIRISYK